MVITPRFAAAQYPEPDKSQDRVFVTERAAIVLDGASAFVPVDVSPSMYVDTLGTFIGAAIDRQYDRTLAEIVSDSIAQTTRELDLRPDTSPSSTVAILRVRAETVEMFVLGDSAIYYGDNSAMHELTDKRLADLNLDESRIYRERLRRGAGYDTQHREILGHLQLKQRKARNRDGGYWIAEADRMAAHRAIVRRLPAQSVAWAVLATDGAYGPLHHLGLDDWRGIAHKSTTELDELLRNAAEWESNEDPTGRKFPRSKISDDKALITVLFE